MSKSTATPVTEQPVLSFVERALAQMNKTEDQIKHQQVSDFFEDLRIDVESTISTLNHDIAKINTDIVRAQRGVSDATKAYEAARFMYHSTSQAYIAHRAECKKQISLANSAVAAIEASKSRLEAQLEEMKSVLADLV